MESAFDSDGKKKYKARVNLQQMKVQEKKVQSITKYYSKLMKQQKIG